MERFKRNFFYILIVFLFLSSLRTLAQNPASSSQSKSGIKSDNSTITGSLNVDRSSGKDIEDIVEKIYERSHKNSDKILINAQWVVTAIMAIVTAIIAMLFYISYRNIADKSKEAITKIQAESQIELSKLNDKIGELTEKIEIGNDVIIKIKSAQAATYYDIAVSSLNKKRYAIALEFLLELYSSNYRLRDICYHIGVCYKNLEEPDYPRALEFFEKARKEAEKDGKEGLVKTIQREIDATRALSQATPISD